MGVIAYECLFGRAPYSSANIKQLHNKIRAQTPIEVETVVNNPLNQLMLSLIVNLVLAILTHFAVGYSLVSKVQA